MSCPACDGRGIVRVRYQDGAPDDFAICQCAAGRSMRSDRNAVGKPCGVFGWQLWAAREHVDITRVFLAEEILDATELAAIAKVDIPAAGAASAIADAMRTKRARL